MKSTQISEEDEAELRRAKALMRQIDHPDWEEFRRIVFALTDKYELEAVLDLAGKIGKETP